ncbi:MAG: hypothetical protein ABIM20_07840, partial [candidate division WOR-3 bacterium]
MLNKNKAYISIEEGKAKVFLPKNQFFEVEARKLPAFLKERRIKEVVVCQFLPNLTSLRFTLPFTQKTIKKKKLLDGIVMGEIRKRYPPTANFAFTYQVYESEGGGYVRCYLLDEEYFDTVNNLIINNINLIGFYPSFFPLLELLRAKNFIKDEGYIVCLISDNTRFVYVFNKDELLLQRSYESSSKNIVDEDILNINMTVSYSLQSLRIKPEMVLFIGSDRQEIDGLTISYDFIDTLATENREVTSYLLYNFEKNLRGKELFLTEQRKFIQNRNYFRYASLVIAGVALFLFAYDISLLSQILKNQISLSLLKKEIDAKQSDFKLLQERVSYFDKNVKPLLTLQNRKNSEIAIKASLYP